MSEITEFIEHHGLSDTAEIGRIEFAVTIFQNFYKKVMVHMQSYEPPSKRHELLSEAYTNIVGRLHEHVSGMLVCLATRNAPSAEALGRTVLETSINLNFMLKGDREKAFLGYCDAWFTSHERQLNQWLEYETTLERGIGNISKIKSRMEMLNGQKIVIDELVSTLGMNRSEKYRDAYPKSLFERFKKVGKEEQYFTSYHRLSNSSHVMAEDTISWLLGIILDDHEKLIAMSKEALEYSQMMSLIVLLTAIESIAMYAIAHNFLDCVNLVQESRSKLISEIERLSKDAGVPQDDI